ncbi:MAG: hypothetical protein KJ726_10130 [Verrucomicrobia bacterium]|nr:hypothetical protein [Verrucomicrobiota bacterium]MBU1910393.1 hypothetical protein [Verrucomicrobiota bacterium]
MKPINIMVKCCRCNRVRVESNWIFRDTEPEGFSFYSHGCCPACLKAAFAEIALAALGMAEWPGVGTRRLALQRVATGHPLMRTR